MPQNNARRGKLSHMVISPGSKTAFAALRRKAEKVAHRAQLTLASTTPADLAHALDELRIYGAELEIQNEELEQSRAQAEELQTRYFRHFDLAPVGMIRDRKSTRLNSSHD